MGTSSVSPSEIFQSSLSLIHRPLLCWGLPRKVAKWEGAAAFELLSADKSGPGALEPGLGQPTGGLTATREKPEFPRMGPSWAPSLIVCSWFCSLFR